MDGADFLSQALRNLTPEELGELINAHDMVDAYVCELMEEEGLDPSPEMLKDEFNDFVYDNDNVYQYVIEMFEEGLGGMGDFDDVESLEEARERLLELMQ